MSSFCENSIACSLTKSVTYKKGAGDLSQVLADLPFNNTAKAQTPRKKVKPGKKLDLPANSHSEASQKKQRENRGTKCAVKEVDKKLDVTVPETKPSQDKKDATNAKKEEPAHHEFEYFDYRVYLAESDDGFTEVVRKHKPRRSVSSLDKTSSNKDSSSSTDREKRRKKSSRSKCKHSATNTDVKKKENSLDKTFQNKGKTSTANTGNRKKEPTSTKATPRNLKRSTASGARSKDQSHTANTKINLSTSRSSAKNPKSEKQKLSDKSNSSLSVPSSTASGTTVPSISKPLSIGMTRSYSSVVAGTNASTATSRSRTIWNSSIGSTTSKKIASVSGSDLVKNSTQKSSLHSSRGMVKLSKQSQPKKKQPEKNQEMYSRPLYEMATSEDKDESSSDLEKKQALVDSSSDERASSEDSDVGYSSLQSYSNSAEKSTSLVSSEKLTNSSHSFSNVSLLGVIDDSTTHSYPENKQELVGSSSDERGISEDSDVGCIMSPTDSSQPDEMNENTDVAWHNFVSQTESFFQSLQSQFNRQQSTYPEFEIEQELVSSFSDERATSEDCDAECTGLEAIGSIELSFMPQFRSTSPERLCNASLHESLINSPNNNLAVSLPDEMTSPVMNVDVNDAWDTLVNQTQCFHQTISVDDLQTTHPKLETNQDERFTPEDGGVLWKSQEPMTSFDNLLMSPNNPLASSLPDKLTSNKC